jgi:hypothetical protein
MAEVGYRMLFYSCQSSCFIYGLTTPELNLARRMKKARGDKIALGVDGFIRLD